MVSSSAKNIEISKPGLVCCEQKIIMNLKILLIKLSNYPIIANEIGESLKTAYTNIFKLLGHQGGNTIKESLYQSHVSYIGQLITFAGPQQCCMNLSIPHLLQHGLARIYVTAAQILAKKKGSARKLLVHFK